MPRRTSNIIAGIMATISFLALLLYLQESRLRPAMGLPLFVAIVVATNALIFGLAWAIAKNTLYGVLRGWLGSGKVTVSRRMYESYRFVDLYHALTRLRSSCVASEFLEAYGDLYSTSLSNLINSGNLATVKSCVRARISVGFEKDDFFPSNSFWMFQRTPTSPRAVMQLTMTASEYTGQCCIELACKSDDEATAIFEHLEMESKLNSIYRGQQLEIRPSSEPADDFSSIAQARGVKIMFRKFRDVSDDQIVLDNHVLSILKRNVIDFHKNREKLGRLGVPRKRALLFHGPPGTGKTFTCQYLRSRLAGVTVFVVSGESLNCVESVCNLARVYQPSLVILEDVDLVFSSREINLYSSALGDFMDQLDGFHPADDIMFILTTNAIDRMEQAIKDRPGRINQCVYFGPPEPELRHRYLNNYLRDYRVNGIDLDHLVKQTNEATQAFLKEYVHRAVQIASESLPNDVNEVTLDTKHFDSAYEELTWGGDKAGQTIMGFHKESTR